VAVQGATVLPNQGTLKLIKSIDLNQLTLMFTTGSSYDPSTSSNSTTVAFSLPFAFPVDITALENNITVGYDNLYFALLALPKAPSTTEVQTRVITLTRLDSTIAGLEGLNAKPVSVSNLDVNHGYPSYLLITADTDLFNPR
jgi:hypothetical protein